jgi:DNA-binding transcriptional LysR family regulator
MASIAVVDGIDPSSLRLFLAVVELGSLSKAALRHGLAQPSATAKLQKLERQLGVQLLERSPTGSTVTPAGVRLAPACAEVVAAVVSLVDRAEALHDEQAGLLVATTRHVADHYLPGWIAGSDLADVRIELVEADTLTVAQTVRSGEAVLGFTDGPAAPIGLRSRLIAREPVVPVVGRRHHWYGRRRGITGRELVAATLILGRRGSGTLDVVEEALAQHGLGTIGDRVEVAGSAAARIAAVNGSGVAFLPRCRVADDVARGDLVVVPVRDVAIEQPVRVVWRGARPSGRPAGRLVDHLRAIRP